jgi:transcriptional regulator with PAS, ATPase and Fis domain
VNRLAGGNAIEKPSTARLIDTSAWSTSPQMEAVHQVVLRAAATDATVLVWGESGVGKENVARMVHARSPRAAGPLVKVNCAALPLELLESELFGYERGAFTGAHRNKPGKFELADGGTMLLDEIGELPLPLQSKLLCVLQDGQFSRLGSDRDIQVDVRVVALTNRDLPALVAAGQFREDLYYRLNVVRILVPPLRDRCDEIPGLVEHFLEKYAAQYAQPVRGISDDTMHRFMTHSWPGNVRELENLIKRIVVLGTEDWVAWELASRPRVLPEPSRSLAGRTGLRPASVEQDDDMTGLGLREIGRRAAAIAERRALKMALDRAHWRRGEAARQLKISYTALLYKMKQYGLRP